MIAHQNLAGEVQRSVAVALVIDSVVANVGTDADVGLGGRQQCVVCITLAEAGEVREKVTGATVDRHLPFIEQVTPASAFSSAATPTTAN